MRLGVSANLDPGGSVHRAAFERAVRWAAGDEGVDPDGFLWISDHASPEGGAEAARRLCAEGAGCVVGHFASGAARAALPVYAAARMPLLLPAATADDLVTPDGLAFRVCPPDRILASSLVRDLRADGISSLAPLSDGSAHGQAMIARVSEAAALCGMRVVGQAEADALLFSGLFKASAAFVRERRAAGDRRLLVLTDDAVHPDLPAACGAGAGGEADGPEVAPLAVYGFAPSEWNPLAAGLVERHRREVGGPPGTYFLETYAAVRIALGALAGARDRAEVAGRLTGGTWPTVLGELATARREAGGEGRHARWEAAGAALVPVRPPAAG
jgi:ABC-type branched-subunit amino acid transport system substrate-binding protein